MPLVKLLPNWGYTLYSYVSLEPGIHKELLSTWQTMFITVWVKHRFWFCINILILSAASCNRLRVYERESWRTKALLPSQTWEIFNNMIRRVDLAFSCIEHEFYKCRYLYITNTVYMVLRHVKCIFLNMIHFKLGIMSTLLAVEYATHKIVMFNITLLVFKQLQITILFH